MSQKVGGNLSSPAMLCKISASFLMASTGVSTFNEDPRYRTMTISKTGTKKKIQYTSEGRYTFQGCFMHLGKSLSLVKSWLKYFQFGGRIAQIHRQKWISWPLKRNDFSTQTPQKKKKIPHQSRTSRNLRSTALQQPIQKLQEKSWKMCRICPTQFGRLVHHLYLRRLRFPGFHGNFRCQMLLRLGPSWVPPTAYSSPVARRLHTSGRHRAMGWGAETKVIPCWVEKQDSEKWCM